MSVPIVMHVNFPQAPALADVVETLGAASSWGT